MTSLGLLYAIVVACYIPHKVSFYLAFIIVWNIKKGRTGKSSHMNKVQTIYSSLRPLKWMDWTFWTLKEKLMVNSHSWFLISRLNMSYALCFMKISWALNFSAGKWTCPKNSPIPISFNRMAWSARNSNYS